MLGVKTGSQAADLGCGAGFYTIPLAKAVGPAGRVYAFDVRPEMLELTRSKARESHMLNIMTMRSDLERERGTNLAENAVDFVLISNTLFQTENKPALLKEAFRILKNDGELALIDWDPFNRGAGPKTDEAVSKDTAGKLAEDAGFRPVKEFDAGENHYGLLYIKL